MSRNYLRVKKNVSIKAIIFDFDGVLVESVDVKTRAFARMFEDKGEEVVQKVTAFHLKNGGLSRVHKFKYYYKEILRCSLSEEKLEELCNIFSRLVIDEVINSIYVRGAREFLEKYHRTIDFYVASGTPEEEIREIVRCRGMVEFFKDVFGSPRQKGEIAKAILQENGYDSSDVIFIGDSITDLMGANGSGIRFIGRVANENDNLFPSDVETIRDIFELRDVVFS